MKTPRVAAVDSPSVKAMTLTDADSVASSSSRPPGVDEEQIVLRCLAMIEALRWPIVVAVTGLLALLVSVPSFH
jgi:hypothetical protein